MLTVSQKDGRTLRRKGTVIQPRGWTVRTVQQILTSPG